MAKVKIAFISNADCMSTDSRSANLARLIAELDAKRVDYEIVIIPADAKAEITADNICTTDYDIVVIDDHINTINILDHCSKHHSEKKRSIFIDGNINAMYSAIHAHLKVFDSFIANKIRFPLLASIFNAIDRV